MVQVILVLVALLTALGAWRAWRRSPLYSVKANFQLAAIFLLMAAALAAVPLAIFSGPVSHSPWAQAILAIVAGLALLTGSTAGILRITDGRVAQLPPSVQLVTIHRRKLHRWLWRAGVVLLIAAGAALAVPSSWRGLPLMLGGIDILLCGSVLFPLYMRARRFDRGISALVAGPWTHWQYTPAQWESWATNQLAWERSKLATIAWRREWPKMLTGVLVMALIFAGFSWLMVDGSAWDKVAAAAGGMALVLVTIICVNWFNRSECERSYRRTLAALPEAYFGAEGLFCSGEYSPWVLSGSYLVEATAPRDPPARLVLMFQTFRSSNFGGSSVRVAKRIPVPEGGERDLELLQQKLRACCPKATVHLIAPAP
jgi:hypothetical protein